MSIEDKINALRAEIQRLRRSRQPVRRRIRSGRPRGRPRVATETIEIARALAGDCPIADVAFKLDISRTTLFNYGITRERLERAAGR